VEVLLFEAVMPSCSRDDAGSHGEALFQLSDWLKKHHRNVTVSQSTRSEQERSKEDKLAVCRALPSDIPEEHRTAVEALRTFAQ
jgi:hypothetical protein